jgi:hypothetical protein
VTRRLISFALLLPAFELALWLVLVPSQAAAMYWRLRPPQNGSQAIHLSAGSFSAVIAPDRLLSFCMETVAMRESPLISSLNMPGFFLELPLSIRSWPYTWHPKTWSWFYWRCMTLPFFCLPAWWFAGRGLDGLLRRRRPRWWTLLIGTILCAAFFTLLVGLYFGVPAADRAEGSWILWGMGFWAFAFSAFPIDWIRLATSRKSALGNASAILP